jgi:RIO kinase 1
VSQSVEHDHPHALEFLRKDITNITEYFKRKGVRVMGIRELFDFITDINIGLDDEQVEAELDKVNYSN